METNLEKAKRLLRDNASIQGIELPEDGFICKMLELAATPDPSNPINNDLNIPDVSVSLPLNITVWKKANSMNYPDFCKWFNGRKGNER